MSLGLRDKSGNVTMPNGHNPVDSVKNPPYLLRMTDISETLDAIGLLCPLPVLKARKQLKSLATGAVLQVLADDPAAVLDMQHFCAESGHEFLGHSDVGTYQVYLIRKG